MDILANTYLALVIEAVNKLRDTVDPTERATQIIKLDTLIKETKEVFDEAGDPYFMAWLSAIQLQKN